MDNIKLLKITRFLVLFFKVLNVVLSFYEHDKFSCSVELHVKKVISLRPYLLLNRMFFKSTLFEMWASWLYISYMGEIAK